MDALVIASLPVALGVVMLGLGLSLTVNDFLRVGRYPRAALTALLCQVVLLPVICLGLVFAFPLSPATALGLMLVAASPGGPAANLFSHLFGGDVALNVTLTAINSVLVVFTLPVVVNLSAALLLPDGTALGLRFGKTAQVFTIVLLPVAAGMLIRARIPALARWLDRPVRVLSIVVLLTVIGAVLWGVRADLAGHLVAAGPAALAFNLTSLLIGYGVPRLTGIERRAAIAAGFEIGIHNTALVITIALSPTLLNSAEAAVPGTVYGIIMFVTAAGFGWFLRGRTAVNHRRAPGRSGEDSAAAGLR
ncbi:BASS family bile acid:Na+ symporter [Catenuloplanes nepalensis]|uniref:BASS family bile acid:Na+ symporter n=1 Tax=Catenuloplanes nepalensis TaxID=587533 RepID=A0ABT9MXM3_9ACTN|nr:bile acid:sodium symporter family protein [Catenuloplanes nepalensis]MDP9796184.1 BASS family bile acid:Na+ symporter [Catenuloplanes nepalensis]